MLDSLAFGVDHLDAIIVLYAGDAHVHAAWVRADAGFTAADAAPRLRDAYRASQSAVRTIDAISSTNAPASVLADAFVTLETPSRVTFLRRVRGYVVASLFDAAMPMGMARLMAHRIAAAVDPDLPSDGMPRSTTPPPAEHELEAKTLAVPPLRPATSRPPPPKATLSELDRAKRLLAFVEARAPDAHIVRLRVALRTGLTPLALEHPEALGADAIVLIETAVQDILGIDRGELRAAT